MVEEQLQFDTQVALRKRVSPPPISLHTKQQWWFNYHDRIYRSLYTDNYRSLYTDKGPKQWLYKHLNHFLELLYIHSNFLSTIL